ncbi:sensor histidine kinase [Nocardioides euryhalodurans]|uniref:histidine kinase n=1 Tax=Nocardioides euryhalodurans TaxID=2518370 RepID=A0A4P7GNQ6_9ACTN|nr:histidine kinase [Nocardioides euryhalodurans]QBR93845.1 histidine kinase [Nocardioides euryhalodurans]
MEQPTPEQYQPRLTLWGHAWRTLVCLLLSALVWSTAVGEQWDHARWLFWVDLAGGLASYVLMFYRRRWPLAVALVISALTLVSGIAAGPATLVSISLATRQDLRKVVLVGVVGVLAAQGYADWQSTNSEPFWITFGFNVAATVGIMGWGMYIGSRRQMLWTLRARAERAEADQEMRVARARGNERARIAREMHDVLAHRISQISMHAGALGFREDLSAEQMRGSAAAIQERAHEALDDLRAVLGVLRDDRTGDVLQRPQPTYADLPELVDQARTSGMTVDFDDRLDAAGLPVPDVAGRTVYRIVQEGMTNAQKHAPGSRLTVELTGSPDTGIRVVLRNPIGFGPGTTPGSGLGLIGLTERADLHGGRLDYRQDGRTWVLRGWIPWAA